jgi:hypothetical protein
VLETASAAYVYDKTLVWCNGAGPRYYMFPGVTFMIDVVCGVAGFTAVVSYTHIYDLGRAHGRTGRPLRLLRRK